MKKLVMAVVAMFLIFSAAQVFADDAAEFGAPQKMDAVLNNTSKSTRYFVINIVSSSGAEQLNYTVEPNEPQTVELAGSFVNFSQQWTVDVGNGKKTIATCKLNYDAGQFWVVNVGGPLDVTPGKVAQITVTK